MPKVLVIAEHHKNQLSPSTLVACSGALKLNTEYDILLVSDKDTLSQSLRTLQGVNTVWVQTDPCFNHILAEDITPVIVSLAKDYTHILVPSTTFGKNFMPRVAALLDVAQISDVTEIVDEETFIRPIYAGNAFEKVKSLDNIKILTIRTTAFDKVPTGSNGQIKPLNYTITPNNQVKFKESSEPESSRPELTSAKIVVAGGRGFKNAENFKMLESLADKLHAAIGASRAAVDAGFVPNDFQVGQTGKVVAPSLYIAIGISGAIQHLAGMKDSKIIVAINKDSDAPIFQVADYGLVGDLFTILPELTRDL